VLGTASEATLAVGTGGSRGGPGCCTTLGEGYITSARPHGPRQRQVLLDKGVPDFQSSTCGAAQYGTPVRPARANAPYRPTQAAIANSQEVGRYSFDVLAPAAQTCKVPRSTKFQKKQYKARIYKMMSSFYLKDCYFQDVIHLKAEIAHHITFPLELHSEGIQFFKLQPDHVHAHKRPQVAAGKAEADVGFEW
jgi:hypothetical protein